MVASEKEETWLHEPGRRWTFLASVTNRESQVKCSGFTRPEVVRDVHDYQWQGRH